MSLYQWLDGFLSGALFVSSITLIIFQVMARVKDPEIKRVSLATIILSLIFSYSSTFAVVGDPIGELFFFPTAIILPFVVWWFFTAILLPRESYNQYLRPLFYGSAILHLIGFILDYLEVPVAFDLEYITISRIIMANIFAGLILSAVYKSRKNSIMPLRIRKRRVAFGTTGGILLLLFTYYSVWAKYNLEQVFSNGFLVARIVQNCIILAVFLAFQFAIHRISHTFHLPRGKDTKPDVDDIKLDKVTHLFEQEKIFRDSNLSIKKVADAVNLTEADTRNLIQIELDYRNFNEFVNSYRVEEIAMKLLDPELNHYKISAIAFESGFNSLSPFNKAFQKRFKMTPSEYRVSGGSGMRKSG